MPGTLWMRLVVLEGREEGNNQKTAFLNGGFLEHEFSGMFRARQINGSNREVCLRGQVIWETVCLP